MYNSQVGLCFLMTSNVINTASDRNMAVSTVALPTPAASSFATETGEVNNRIWLIFGVSLNRCSETVYVYFSPRGWTQLTISAH